MRLSGAGDAPGRDPNKGTKETEVVSLLNCLRPLNSFLFHYRNGKYAKWYKTLIAQGATLEAFEKLIGPVDQVQREWYEYLQEKIIEVKSPES